MLTLTTIGKGAYHIQTDGKSASLLTRYGILNEKLSRDYFDAKPSIEGMKVSMSGSKRDVSLAVTQLSKGGFKIDVPITANERFYGLGDSTREGVMHRGRKINIWVSNVKSYGPMPILYSTEGWAILINSTFRQRFDIGAEKSDLLTVYVQDGLADFYLFSASTMLDLLCAVTDITGKPSMLPKFAYGMTFIENEDETNSKTLLEDIVKIRELGIPCDAMSLEPSWMETNYDFSTEKKWDPVRFPRIYWKPDNDSHGNSFFGPIRNLGMQLSLWLCEDYDTFYEEERQAKAIEEENYIPPTDEEAEYAEFNKNAEFLDRHLTKPIFQDKITKINEPWFEHLKKFVDNGAAMFKLDGSNQVLEHPDRLWGGKYLDAEAHNIYPLILEKQMFNGFFDHTGRRPMIFSAGAYIGTQKYSATWAGDTGGGPRTLVSALNYAICGHTNTSCDMDVISPQSVHFCCLSPWVEIDSWKSHYNPQYMIPKTRDCITRYLTLRSSLIPYIYSTAHTASVTGIPINRPLHLMFEDENYIDIINAYMLGDYFFVGAFDMNMRLPKGEWIDYFTGKKYTGGEEFTYNIPEGFGGALFVKSGAIIPKMKPQQYILEKPHEYEIEVFLGDDASFSLYEDDGFTFDYENGGYAVTPIFLLKSDNAYSLTVSKRRGCFEGRPDNGHNHYLNSIPKINGIPEITDIKIRVFDEGIKSVELSGKTVDITRENGFVEFIMPNALHEEGDLTYKIVI